MRNLLIDTLGLGGFGALSCGLYLHAGAAVTLMVSGSIAMLIALIAQMRGGRR